MARKASMRTASSSVKSTHDAVETAIDLSKKSVRGTWEGSARKLGMSFVGWEFERSKATSGPSDTSKDEPHENNP